MPIKVGYKAVNEAGGAKKANRFRLKSLFGKKEKEDHNEKKVRDYGNESRYICCASCNLKTWSVFI